MTERTPRELLAVRAAHGMTFLSALVVLVAASPLMGKPIWPYMLFAGAMLMLTPVSYWLIHRNDRDQRSTPS